MPPAKGEGEGRGYWEGTEGVLGRRDLFPEYGWLDAGVSTGKFRPPVHVCTHVGCARFYTYIYFSKQGDLKNNPCKAHSLVPGRD